MKNNFISRVLLFQPWTPERSSTAMADTNTTKKRKQRYLPYNKPVKKKGSYPLRPGVRGFFITCDGGRERQASRDALFLIDSFYDELVNGKDKEVKQLGEMVTSKPLNKKIKFVYSDDEDDVDDEDEDEDENQEKNGEGGKEYEENGKEDEKDGKDDNDSNTGRSTGAKSDIKINSKELDCACLDNSNQESQAKDKDDTSLADESKEPPAKKPCMETSSLTSSGHTKVTEKSVDELIEDELKELGDKSKDRKAQIVDGLSTWNFIKPLQEKCFVNLDSGCNGVVFIQMRKTDEGPSPKGIVHQIMASAASTRKHMSRFILRVLPVEIACYASEEEISKAMTTVVENYFPANAQEPQKFAVLYEARANTGIDRMKIINAVAKSVPGPHKVDLSNPEKTIVVEIVKTVCLIGVVEKYKELSKYNLRQLTSSKH